MKPLMISALLAALVTLYFSTAAQAQEEGVRPPVTAEEVERLRSLPPEQRQAERERLRERWEAMTPEARQALRRQAQERRPLRRQESAKKHEQMESGPVPGAGDAPAARRERLRERWKAMTPEERRAARERFRRQGSDGSPEERAARRERLRERWKSMSPEERERLRRDFEEAGRHGPGGMHRPHPGNGGRGPER